MKKHLTRPFKRITKPLTLLNPVLKKIIPGYKKLPQRFQKTVSMVLLVAILIGLVSPMSPLFKFFNKEAEAAWWNDNWQYRRQLTIDNSSVSTTQTNFPILVTLNSSRIDYNYTQAAGQDIRFTDCFGQNVYAHEIEVWDEAGTSYVWVKIPTMLATATNCMYVYYGNPSAPDGQRIRDVWSNGYSHVYHFANSGGTNNGKNSVNNSSAGTTLGAGYTDAAGKIGRGYANSTNNTPFQTTDDRTGSTAITVEAWLQPPNPCINWTDTGEQGWVGNGWAIFIDSSCRLNFGVGLAGAQGTRTTTSTVSTGTINNYIVGSYDTNGDDLAYAYINGTASGSAPTARNNAATDTTTTITSMINDTGTVDEFRISNVQRSADWISAQYESMNDTLISTYGSAEKAPGPVTYWAFDDPINGTTTKDSTTTAMNGTLNTFASPATGSSGWQTQDKCISNNCLQYDGGSDYVGFTTQAITNFNQSDPFTISTWIRPAAASVGTTSYVFNKQQAVNNEFCASIYLNSSSKIAFDTCKQNVSSVTAQSINTISANQWYFVTAVSDGTTMTLYVNGVLQNTATITFSSAGQSTANINLGRQYNGSNFFAGTIDDTKIYDYARSAAQVKMDYNSQGNAGMSGSSAVMGVNTDNNFSNGLLGYWKMDESSWTVDCSTGSVLDSSGNGNNGAACPNSTGPAGGAGGKFMYAGSFDGADYISVANSSNQHIPLNGAVTMAAWVKISGNGSIIYKLNTSNFVNGYAMGTSSGCLSTSFFGSDGSGGDVTDFTTCTITDNSWHHVVATYDYKTVKLYVDGILRTSQALTVSTSMATTDAMTLAGDQFSKITGLQDETRVYNRALSGAEVTQLYNWGPDPVAFWKMEEKTGTTISDSTGNGNTSSAFTGDVAWTTGKFGAGLKFDGSGDVVRIPETTITDIGATTDSFTIGAWFRATGSGSIQEVLSKDINSGGYIRFGLNGSNVMFLQISDGTNTTLCNSSSLALNDGKWHYIAATRDVVADQLKGYYDGTLGCTATDTTTGSIANNADWSIGNGGTSYTQLPLTGAVDNAVIYRYARTAAQVNEDMNASHPLGGSPVGSQVVYYKFDEGYGTTANTATVLNTARTGSISGATWSNSGKMGKTLSFDGTDDVVTVTNNQVIDFNEDLANFTFAAWVYADTDGEADTGQIFQKGTNNYFRVDTQDGSNNVDLEYNLDRTTDTNVNITDAFQINTWNHVAATWDGTTLKVYVNGNMRGSSSSGSGAIATDTANLLIGGTTTNNFDGFIDEFKIYSTALAQADINIDYNRNASQVLGATGNNSSFQVQAQGQEYCVSGSTDTCTAPGGRWDFEEKTSTSAFDTSTNGNVGTLTNSPAWTNGKVGTGLEFDEASSKYVNVPDANSLDSTAALTLEAWVKPTANDLDNNYADVVGKGDSTAASVAYSLSVLDADTASFWWCAAAVCADWQISGTTVFTAGQWTHIAVTRDTARTTVYMYINGVRYTATNTTGLDPVPGGGSDDLAIGRPGEYVGQYFDGTIDQVRVFTYERTPAQIAMDYNKGLPVGHWKSDDCQGTTLNDASGNSMSATITIGGSGTYTTPGSCGVSSASSAWYNGRNGKINSSLAYDGTDDYAEVASNAKLSSTAGTWSGWVKTSQGTSSYYIIMVRASGTSLNGITMFQDITTGKLRVQVKDASTTAVLDLTGGTALNNGAWHHVAFTFNGTSTGYLYVDGKLATSGTPSGSWSFGANVLRFADANDPFWSFWTGQLDDMRVYNYPLTATQIKTLYTNGAINFAPVTGAP